MNLNKQSVIHLLEKALKERDYHKSSAEFASEKLERHNYEFEKWDAIVKDFGLTG